jgi:glycosyltransferase involved in cell wall biosynthesis
MKNKKILFIVHLPPPTHGASKVNEYIKNSNKIVNNYECTFINISTAVNLSRSNKFSINKIIKFINIFAIIIKNLTVRNYDLCYMTISGRGKSLIFKDAVIITLIKLCRIKLVYHLHNKGIKKDSKKFLHNLIYRYVFHNCKLILLSKRLLEDVIDYIDEENVFYCPNGIQFQNSNSFYKKKTKIHFLFLSNLIESKGVNEIILASKLLKDKGYSFVCQLIGAEGEISTNDIITRITENELEGIVNYLGPKYNGEKEKYLNESNIFIFPSYYENECFPLVILEAMANELAIITTEEGAILDIIEDNITGLICKRKDYVDLSKKMEILLVNHDFMEFLAKNAKERWRKNYRLDIFENNLINILNKILEYED